MLSSENCTEDESIDYCRRGECLAVGDVIESGNTPMTGDINQVVAVATYGCQ